jgi:hypothetical protein
MTAPGAREMTELTDGPPMIQPDACLDELPGVTR